MRDTKAHVHFEFLVYYFVGNNFRSWCRTEIGLFFNSYLKLNIYFHNIIKFYF